jgi:glycosyltransferase involved in cell wall biosynthesis
MTELKKVSIIITCHNFEKYIFRAINSCLNQNFPEEDYEIIIIDDASTDRSREIISSYKNFPFIKTVFLKKNRHVAVASNAGLKLARGKYVVRVDGDDFIHKDFLGVMTAILDYNEDVGFVYCDLIVVQGEVKEVQRAFQLNTFKKLLDHGAGVMFRRRNLEKVGFYKENLRNCEDMDLILRYSRKNKGYHLRLPYYRYFKRKGSLSTKRIEREKIKKDIFKKYVGKTNI